MRVDEENEKYSDAVLMIGKRLRFCICRMAGETALQLHGAIGFTEEYILGRYYKRLLVIDALCGNADHQLQTYITGSKQAGAECARASW